MIRVTKSVRSLHSTETTVSSVEIPEANQVPSLIFEELLPFVCKKFGCDFEVYVKKDYVHDEFRRYMSSIPIKKKREGGTVMPFTSKKSAVDETKETITVPDRIAEELGAMTVIALYDSSEHLVEILLYRIPHVPRELVQAIAVIVSTYDRLTKISMRNCGIDGYVLHEMNKVVCLMTLTDLCLDDCYQPQANFVLLLEIATSLRNLSLARCKLYDKGCQKIVSQLHFSAPAERTLVLLNLSGNHITDVGAKYIGEMLRTNRNLRYLNLTSNGITDDGARCIFDVLKEFPLTYEEITDKRGRLFDYLRKRKSVMSKYLIESDAWSTTFMDIASNHSSRKSTVKKSVSSEKSSKQVSLCEVTIKKQKEQVSQFIQAKITLLTDQVMGQFYDPFSHNNVTTKNGWPHCIGNMKLSYLNLSYNYLSYLSVKKVAEVLVYQGTLTNMECGLVKINIDGNNIPVTCDEYGTISQQLKTKLVLLTPKDSSKFSKRKSHAKISIAPR